MKIKIEDLKPLRLYGSENEGSTLSLKVGKPDEIARIESPRVDGGNG